MTRAFPNCPFQPCCFCGNISGDDTLLEEICVFGVSSDIICVIRSDWWLLNAFYGFGTTTQKNLVNLLLTLPNLDVVADCLFHWLRKSMSCCSRSCINTLKVTHRLHKQFIELHINKNVVFIIILNFHWNHTINYMIQENKRPKGPHIVQPEYNAPPFFDRSAGL